MRALATALMSFTLVSSASATDRREAIREALSIYAVKSVQPQSEWSPSQTTVGGRMQSSNQVSAEQWAFYRLKGSLEKLGGSSDREVFSFYKQMLDVLDEPSFRRFRPKILQSFMTEPYGYWMDRHRTSQERYWFLGMLMSRMPLEELPREVPYLWNFDDEARRSLGSSLEASHRHAGIRDLKTAIDRLESYDDDTVPMALWARVKHFVEESLVSESSEEVFEFFRKRLASSDNPKELRRMLVELSIRADAGTSSDNSWVDLERIAFLEDELPKMELSKKEQRFFAASIRNSALSAINSRLLLEALSTAKTLSAFDQLCRIVAKGLGRPSSK